MRNGGKQCTMSADVSVMAPVCQGGVIFYIVWAKTRPLFGSKCPTIFLGFLEHFKPIFRCIDCLEGNDPPPPPPPTKSSGAITDDVCATVSRPPSGIVCVHCWVGQGWMLPASIGYQSSRSHIFFSHKNGMIEFRRLRI